MSLDFVLEAAPGRSGYTRSRPILTAVDVVQTFSRAPIRVTRMARAHGRRVAKNDAAAPHAVAAVATADEKPVVERLVDAIAPGPEWRQVVKTVLGYVELKAGWYGGEGVAPSAELLGKVLGILVLFGKQAHIPTSYVMPDGEVGLQWKANDRFVSVSFPPDGNIVGYATGPGWEVLEIDEDLSAAPVVLLKARVADL